MSIIARIRPTVQTKAHRVSPAKPVPFGAGILPVCSPERPWEAELRATLASLGYDQAAQNASVSWVIFRGSLTYFPLTSREHWSVGNAILRKHAQAPAKFRDVAPLPVPPVVEVKPVRPYSINIEDCREFAEMMADIEDADREQQLEYEAIQADWADRLSGHPTDADVMLATGCVG